MHVARAVNLQTVPPWLACVSRLLVYMPVVVLNERKKQIISGKCLHYDFPNNNNNNNSNNNDNNNSNNNDNNNDKNDNDNNNNNNNDNNDNNDNDNDNDNDNCARRRRTLPNFVGLL